MFRKTFKPIINPYIIHGPVRTSTLFFGRENDFKIIQNWIMRGSAQVILLAGERATGKTSILCQMLDSKLAEVGETIFCDFQVIMARIKDNEDIPLEIGKCILENEQFKKFSADFSAESSISPTLRLQNLVERCLEAISPRKLILLCDEFTSIETHFTQASLSVEALAWAKRLLARSVYFIMTGDHEFKNEAVNEVFGSAIRKRLIPDLSQQDTLLLIKKPVEENLTYKGNVPQMIYRLSGGHPFYTQYLCHALVNYVNLELKHNQAVLKDVNDVVDAMVRNPSDYLLEIWQSDWKLEGAPPATKMVLAALASTLQKPDEYVSNSRIYKTAKKQRFPIEEKTLFETLAWLKHKTHLLDWQTKDYRFRVDLLRHWIAHTFQTAEDIDLLEVKTELTVTKKRDALKETTFQVQAPFDNLFPEPSEPLSVKEPEKKEISVVEVDDAITQEIADTGSFSKEEAYAEKLETLLQDETITAEEKVVLGDLTQEDAYNNYVKELETFLQAGTITFKERKTLDQSIIREHLDFEQAFVVENRLRERLTLDFIDWKQEYEISCQALKAQYAQKVPKTAVKELYDTYVSLKRVPKSEAKAIAQSLGLPVGLELNKWFSRVSGKEGTVTSSVPKEATTERAEGASQAHYAAYAEQVETFLQDGVITTKERAELDSIIATHGFDQKQANLIENEVRKKLGLKPLDWTQEYRSNCYTLKERYPHRIPRNELKKLNLYVSPERVTRKKADEISRYVGLQAELRGLYAWLAIAGGALLIAVLVLSQLVPLLTPIERVKPAGEVKGIQASYHEGDSIDYVMQGNDNIELQRLQFTVSDTRVQESWQVSGQTILKKASVSTKGWEANRSYTYYYTVMDQAGNEYKASGTFRVEESVPPTVEMSSIEEKYTVGDTIHYAVKAEDNLALKSMTFTVSTQLAAEASDASKKIPPEEVRPEETPEELAEKAEKHYKEWDITGLQSSKQSSSFSTEGWQAGNYTYVVQIVDNVGNLTVQKSHFALLAKEVIASVPPLPLVNVTAPVVASVSNPEVSQLLQQCTEHFEANRLTTGQGGTALECYRQVLSHDADNALAQVGLQKIEDKYIRWTESAIASRQTNKASDLLQRLRQVNPNSTALSRLETALQQLPKTPRQQISDDNNSSNNNNKNVQSGRSRQNSQRRNPPPERPPTRRTEPTRPPSPMPDNQLF